MEYTTILVRWSTTPNAHINLTTDGARNWYMSEWTKKSSKRAKHRPDHEQHLTVICVHIAEDKVSDYMTRLKRFSLDVWVDPCYTQLVPAGFDALLTASPSLFNYFSVTHTSVRPGDSHSFYGHVSATVALIKSLKWTMRDDIADEVTALKVRYEHVSVTVSTHSTLTLCYDI